MTLLSLSVRQLTGMWLGRNCAGSRNRRHRRGGSSLRLIWDVSKPPTQQQDYSFTHFAVNFTACFTLVICPRLVLAVYQDERLCRVSDNEFRLGRNLEETDLRSFKNHPEIGLLGPRRIKNCNLGYIENKPNSRPLVLNTVDYWWCGDNTENIRWTKKGHVSQWNSRNCINEQYCDVSP